jgi:hypothetical protein
MTLVNLAAMKAKALNFPEPVKSLILSEPATIDAQDFISKLGTWEKLLRMPQNGGTIK